MPPPGMLCAFIFAVLLIAQTCQCREPAPQATSDQSPRSVTARAIPQPPVTKRRPHKIVKTGNGRKDVRQDPYFWLRDDNRTDPDGLAYLKAENDYLEALMSDTDKLQSHLYAEMRGRTQEADQTAPQRKGGYFYYDRTVEGGQYSVRCRRKIPDGMGAPSELDVMDENIPEEILLDENAEAKNHSFYRVEGFEVSPDGKLIMYAEDTTGNELYTLHVKEISTGREMLEEPITHMSTTAAFAMDSKTIIYVKENKQRRPYKVFRHTLGTSLEDDESIYEEKDDGFWVGVWRSHDNNYIFVRTDSLATREAHYLDAWNPAGKLSILYKRKKNRGYSVQHRGGYFYVKEYDQNRPNQEISIAPVSNTKNRTVVIPHSEEFKMTYMIMKRNFMIVFGRKNGLRIAVVYKLPKMGSPPVVPLEGKELEFNETAYVVDADFEREFESDILRIHYTSLTTPASVIDLNMVTGNRAVKKVDTVLGGFNQSLYETRRIWATANDSTKIPISLVYRKDAVKLDGSDPLLLFVYGAYGLTQEPRFSEDRLSLLDRGVVYATAHVRGGGAMGREWWEAGKLLNKKTTFTDAIACAEELLNQNYSSPERMAIHGRSAGGTAVAVIINMRPDLFKAAIADVPFVDCLTTLLDTTQRLTVTARQEWGNPNSWKHYDYIKDYSPIDNVEAKDYPNLLVTTGLFDGRVGYWEAAKYVAKLRSLKTDDNLLVLETDMSSGHFSESGRFDRLRGTALRYAFLIKSLGFSKEP